MARPPMTNDGRTMTGYPMRSASVSASSIDSAMPPSGCGIPSRSRSAENRVRSSAWSIVSRLEPSSGTPACTSGAARLSGVWPPYATTAGSGHAGRADGLRPRRVPPPALERDDAPHALGIERLEVQARRRVEVGRHGLGVRVDHHGAPALAPEDVGRLDGAVVELDPLPDPDRAAADDEGGGAGDRGRLGRRAGRGVGRVEVRRLGRELGGARVDHRVPGLEAELGPGRPHVRLPHPGQGGQVAVGEARPLGGREEAGAVRIGRVGEARAGGAHVRLETHVAAHLGEEPGRDPGRLADGLLGHAAAEQAEDPPQPRVRRLDEPAEHDRRGRALGEAGALAGVAALVDPADDDVVLAVVARVHRREVVERRLPRRVLAERPGPRLLEAPERLVERGAEGPVDRHHLARRLHLRPEASVGGRELVEREPGQLDDDVVERGLEGRDRGPGDDVGDVGERAAGGDLGRDAGDRVARGLGRERRRARDARVDLDDRVLGASRATARTGRCSRPRRPARG